MNLITIIENIEIERSNNTKLGEAVDQRLTSLKSATEAMLGQARIFVEQLENQHSELIKATMSVRQEFADRDAALLALIGGSGE